MVLRSGVVLEESCSIGTHNPLDFAIYPRSVAMEMANVFRFENGQRLIEYHIKDVEN